MIRLNLPPFEMKISGTKQQPKILDILRRNISHSLQKNGCDSTSSTFLSSIKDTLLPYSPMRSSCNVAIKFCVLTVFSTPGNFNPE